MKKIQIFLILFFAFFSYSKIYAIEFSHFYGSIGYYEHTAKDPNDSLGSTYNDDPNDKSFMTSLGYAYKNGNFLWDTELSYYGKVSHKLTTGVNMDVTTLSIIENLIFVSDQNFMVGAGLGMANINLDLDYSSGGDTLSKDKSVTKLGHQFLFGYGLKNYEIIYKYTDFGQTSGPSGTTKNGNAYVSDEFDNIYNSISLRYKF